MTKCRLDLNLNYQPSCSFLLVYILKFPGLYPLEVQLFLFCYSQMKLPKQNFQCFFNIKIKKSIFFLCSVSIKFDSCITISAQLARKVATRGFTWRLCYFLLKTVVLHPLCVNIESPWYMLQLLSSLSIIYVHLICMIK